MAGAHDCQEPLTAPKQPPPAPQPPPFTSLTPPKTLPHSPTSPRLGLQPESGQNWENDLLLVYRGRGMPGMGQRISAMPRILRMRVTSSARGRTAGAAGGARHQPDRLGLPSARATPSCYPCAPG